MSLLLLLSSPSSWSCALNRGTQQWGPHPTGLIIKCSQSTFHHNLQDQTQRTQPLWRMCCWFSFDSSFSLQNSVVANCWEEIWKNRLYVSELSSFSETPLTLSGAGWFTDCCLLAKGPRTCPPVGKASESLGLRRSSRRNTAATGDSAGSLGVLVHWHVKYVTSAGKKKVVGCFAQAWGVYLKLALNRWEFHFLAPRYA